MQIEKVVFIITENRIIGKEIIQMRRVMSRRFQKSTFYSLINGAATEQFEKENLWLIEEGYKFLSATNSEHDLILDVGNSDSVFEAIDYLLKKYNSSISLESIKKLFKIRSIENEKISSKFVDKKDQVSIINILDFPATITNKNSICFIDTEEKLYYIKDNINSILDKLIESDLQTLDLYIIPKEELDLEEFLDSGPVKLINRAGKTVRIVNDISDGFRLFLLEVN